MKRNAMILAAAAAGVILLGAASLSLPAMAFPHALKSLPITVHGHEKRVLIVIGHTNEPTFGLQSGVHDGKHNVEVFLEDEATGLPIPGAGLKINKFYFKDLKAFQKAKSLNDANEIIKNVPLPEAFGDPGHYVARQVHQDGIYGYRLFGTIDYFGEASVPIDEKIFCRPSGEGGGGGSGTTKFNTAGWFGGYGCTDKITDVFFPKNNKGGNGDKGDNDKNDDTSYQWDSDDKLQPVSFDSRNWIMAETSSGESAWNAYSLQILAFSISGATVAGVLGIRSYIHRQRDQTLDA